MVPFIYQHFIKWNLEFWPKPLLGVPIHNTVLTLNLLIANYFRLKYKRPKPTLEMDVWLQQHQRRQKVLWDGFLW